METVQRWRATCSTACMRRFLIRSMHIVLAALAVGVAGCQGPCVDSDCINAVKAEREVNATSEELANAKVTVCKADVCKDLALEPTSSGGFTGEGGDVGLSLKRVSDGEFEAWCQWWSDSTGQEPRESTFSLTIRASDGSRVILQAKGTPDYSEESCGAGCYTGEI